VLLLAYPRGTAQQSLLPIPDRLVVMTIDDGTKTDITQVAPVLRRYGFGATFYVTDGLRSIKRQDDSLTWDDIRELNKEAFEIGNHTENHPDVRTLSKKQLVTELEGIEERCKQNGIPVPTTFAYPGWQFNIQSAQVLLEKGYLFARRGVAPEFPDKGWGARGPVYDPAKDSPLLIPTTGYAGPKWGMNDLIWAIDQAKGGKIAVLAFHGVPYPRAPWVSTSPKDFESYMKYLHDRGCTVPLQQPKGSYRSLLSAEPKPSVQPKP
jgi:peptidoglycan/xylan/chitin deacetylase (PgdA/CDA1 family)